MRVSLPPLPPYGSWNFFINIVCHVIAWCNNLRNISRNLILKSLVPSQIWAAVKPLVVHHSRHFTLLWSPHFLSLLGWKNTSMFLLSLRKLWVSPLDGGLHAAWHVTELSHIRRPGAEWTVSPLDGGLHAAWHVTELSHIRRPGAEWTVSPLDGGFHAAWHVTELSHIRRPGAEWAVGHVPPWWDQLLILPSCRARCLICLAYRAAVGCCVTGFTHPLADQKDPRPSRTKPVPPVVSLVLTLIQLCANKPSVVFNVGMPHELDVPITNWPSLPQFPSKRTPSAHKSTPGE